MSRRNLVGGPSLAERLAERMRAYIAKYPEEARELQPHIDALERLSYETPIPKVLVIWARARKCWAGVTEEPLV